MSGLNHIANAGNFFFQGKTILCFKLASMGPDLTLRIK